MGIEAGAERRIEADLLAVEIERARCHDRSGRLGVDGGVDVLQLDERAVRHLHAHRAVAHHQAIELHLPQSIDERRDVETTAAGLRDRRLACGKVGSERRVCQCHRRAAGDEHGDDLAAPRKTRAMRGHRQRAALQLDRRRVHEPHGR